ncbi:MAG: DivIVA domain-containing protein [Halanaerobiales bacterium]|nr:DivIVA domain-containing protein [Halanaerobiales bacterium]
MKLNPLDIYNKEFTVSALGYNKSQVEEFLDDIGVEYERMLQEIKSLQERNDKLKEKLKSYENIEENLKSTLRSIEEIAEKQTQQAREEANMIIEKANVEAEKMKQNVKKELAEEYDKLEKLKETKTFFKIRLRNLLESQLEVLEEEDEEINIEKYEEKIDNLTNT